MRMMKANNVQLEEMDWQRAKTEAKEQIRQARMMLEIGSEILERAEIELKIIWENLPADEREKREKNK